MAKPKTTVRKGVRMTTSGPKVVTTKPDKSKVIGRLIKAATGR